MANGKQVEIIDVGDGYVDYRHVNGIYRGVCQCLCAVSSPAKVDPLPDNPTQTDIDAKYAAMQAALDAAIALAEPIVKTVLDSPVIKDERTLSTRDQILVDNLPAWSQVDAAIEAISTIAGIKAYLKKIKSRGLFHCEKQGGLIYV